eukprot:6214232-Amphidinium_carterae.1
MRQGSSSWLCSSVPYGGFSESTRNRKQDFGGACLVEFLGKVVLANAQPAIACLACERARTKHLYKVQVRLQHVTTNSWRCSATVLALARKRLKSFNYPDARRSLLSSDSSAVLRIQ